MAISTLTKFDPSLDNVTLHNYCKSLIYNKLYLSAFEMIQITEKVWMKYRNLYPSSVKNSEIKYFMSSLYYKISDISATNRKRSFNAFLKYLKLDNKLFTKRSIRLYLLWLGGVELRFIFNQFKFLVK